MTGLDVASVLAELKGFQRDAVDHVIDRLYDAEDAGRRFLVADETGLGKSVVARGVIARAIEKLEADDSVDRIDIVYVCSNADLAQQNLQRLNVTGNEHLAMTGRLTLLALQSQRLAGHRVDRKVVNLVSFTPGTSFEMGWRTGTGEERALLHVILTDALGLSSAEQRAAERIFQDRVQKGRFSWQIQEVRRVLGGPVHDPILQSFIAGASARGLLDRFRQQVAALSGRPALWASEKESVRQLTAEFRAELARASVATLEPDLVILDEFQRFRHLLDPETGGEAADLAHHLFDYDSAKVLLLSATPYKPYTARQSDAEEDHYSDFMTTLGFLVRGDQSRLAEIRRLFADYRDGVVQGRSVDDTALALRSALLKIMSRTERPVVDWMVVEDTVTTGIPREGDLESFAGLRALATALDTPLPLEYWKSVPQFGNFMDTYQLSRALDRHEDVAALAPVLRAVGSITAEDTRGYEPVDGRNAALRELEADMLDSGLWKLLWLPPSLPYFRAGGPYRDHDASSTTKRLVFSSWTATPTSVASLLSYGAERRTVEGSRLVENSPEARRLALRLAWKMDGDRPGAMSALSLFWPHPELASLGDPLALARRDPAHELDADDAVRAVSAALGQDASADEAWRAFFGSEGSFPVGVEPWSVVSSFATRGGPEDGEPESEGRGNRGLEAHVAAALDARDEDGWAGHPLVADLAVHSPGNIAYRALGRIRTDGDGTSAGGHWLAAAQLAGALRTLFNRLETTLLLDKLYGTTEPYWRVILSYCADGNLQAVLDEYVHQLRSESAGSPLDDTLLLRIAERAAGAMSLRPSTYRARDLVEREGTIPFTARFALRYGGRQQDQESARQPEIRAAFNSPFWPFVLASTSVGQEGIDFHWWSHAVVHWNLPSNPVDFEQREGRVNRFAGHAVRKNVAAAHRSDVLLSTDADPWQAAFAAAADAHPELGEFAPYWMYPGASAVRRQVITYPLSRDTARFSRLKDALTLYRLTLGQPRQQDMLELMIRRGVTADSVAKLDLSPPRRPEN